METKEICPYNNGCKDNCKHCLRFSSITQLMKLADIPERYWYNREVVKMFMDESAKDYTAFEQLDQIQQNINDFVSNGEQLYICSTKAGNGKTTWAVKLLIAYLDAKSYWLTNQPRGMFVNVSDYLYKSKDFNNQLPKGYRDNMQSCDLLVLDDIAIAGLTDYDFMNLYGVIERRNFAGLATIYTGNETDPEIMEDILGERLTSRIWNSSKKIKFSENDRRGRYTI